MKLLFILSIGLDAPGPSVHILASLFEGLAKKGHEVMVILQKHTDGAAMPENLQKLGVKYQAIDASAAPKNNFALRYIEQLRYAKTVSALLREYADADVVYVHSNTAQLAFANAVKKHIKSAKLVLNVQDIFPENMAAAGLISAKNPLYALMCAMQHCAYRKADAVITLSEDMKDTLTRAGAGNVRVIPLWSYSDDVRAVDDEKNEVLKQYPEQRGFFRIVYAGNVGSMQNVEVILRAAKLLIDEKGIHFLIVGEGARLESLKCVKAEEGLDNVFFIPMQPSKFAPDVYSMANVNLITLKKSVVKTAFPSKTTTCCAVGKPIIACVDADSIYAKMIAGLDNCEVVNSDDASALAKAILVLRDSGAFSSRGAVELYASRLSQSAGIQMHEALFEQLKGDGASE